MATERQEGSKRVLCVGLTCLDIINVCASYPLEDSDQRVINYYWQRGGNASNTSSVLALLGENVELMATLVRGPEFGFLEKDITSLGIHIDHCVFYDGSSHKCPVATVVLNQQNGSRTLMFAANNVELRYEDFDQKIDLQDYKWIHFEGRQNIEEIAKMLQKIAFYNSTLPKQDRLKASLELEKPRRKQLVELIPYVDVAFISKDFAAGLGFLNKEETVQELSRKCREGGSIVCAWGEDGAAGQCGSCDTVTSPIFPPEKLVDTLAAGDTFNAGTIFALARGRSLREAITFGCKVAGAKCGMTGLLGLRELQPCL